MRKLILSVAVLALSASACGSSSDSLSCNNTTAMTCTTVSITGGTLTNKSCNAGFDLVASCATTGVIGRCTWNGSVPGSSLTCPSGATCSTVLTVYTGGDAAAAQASCTQSGGTWSTP